MNRIFKFIISILKGLTLFLLFFLLITSFLYFNTEVYNLEKHQPFSGNKIYNPYKNYSGKTLRANFHAHSNTHKNLTNGAQQPQQVIDHYKNNGYDIISLSDYNKINYDKSDIANNYIDNYEHGINTGKRHQLVLNAKSVKLFDFPFFQSIHQKQYIIKKLKQDDALVVLAHPKLWDGYTARDMEFLKGIDLIEIKNHYKSSTQIWDDALSSGNLVWALSNDDCHNIEKAQYTFVNWNRIGASENNKEVVLEALKKGNHYAFSNKQERIETNYLDSCILEGNVVTVYFSKVADKISFIGAHGIIKKEIENSKFASYEIKPSDSYIRIESFTGKGEMYLNPLVRYSGNKLIKSSAFPPINSILTILYRLTVLIISSLIIVTMLFITGIVTVSIRKTKAILKFKLPRFAFK